MKKLLIISLSVLAIVVSYNCKKPVPININLNLPERPYDYRSVTTDMGRMQVLYANGRQIDNYKATIGRVLFYDKALSINNTVACGSCHLQKNAFSDPVAFSKGFDGEITLRNSIGINNLSDEEGVGFFWDAREENIENMVFMPIANHIEMGFERIDLITEKISNLPYYKRLFRDAYGDERVTPERFKESLGNFLFSIVSFNTKFDRNINNPNVFTDEENRGKDLFVSRHCNTCHFISVQTQIPSSYGNKSTTGSTGNTGGLNFANNGLDENDIDKGHNGEYKIPRLKNISKTAPYMHDGRFKTLEEVLEHYSHNIQNNPKLHSLLTDGYQKPKRFNFSDQQKSDLIAFLKTLDDDVMPVDIRFSSPFD